ncbi:MAG: hypothetical protein ABUS48_00415 [Pseudomonadota bacterium]
MTLRLARLAALTTTIFSMQMLQIAQSQNAMAPDGQVNANQRYTLKVLATCTAPACTPANVTVGTINASCEIAGSLDDKTHSVQLAFVWRPDFPPQQLAGGQKAGDASDHEAIGINDAHQVVGWGYGSGYQTALLWTVTPQSSSWVAAPLNGANVNDGKALNSAGQVVGSTSFHGREAMYWSGGTPLPLGDLPHTAMGKSSVAYGINDSGAIIGTGEADVGSTTNVTRAFYIAPSSTMLVDLGALGGGAGVTRARAINASGTVVGESGGVGPNLHAVTWRVSASGSITITDLGAADAAGLSSSGADGINASGSVVGYIASGMTTRHAAAWTPTSTSAFDLNDQSNASASGITLTEAFGVNADGVISAVGDQGATKVVVALIPTNFPNAAAHALCPAPITMQAPPPPPPPGSERDRQPTHPVLPPPPPASPPPNPRDRHPTHPTLIPPH